MSVRGLLVAVVLLGILGAAAFWSERNKAAEDAKEASGGAAKLVNVKDDQITRIQIQRRDGSAVELDRDPSNQWKMTSPETWRVDQEAANSIASTYATLRYDRVVDEKPTNLTEYGLQPPLVELTFKSKDGKTRKLLLGDDVPTGAANYAKLDGDARVFTIANGPKSSLDKSPSDLRDKRLLVFEADKLTRMELTSGKGAYEFGRNAHKEWQIVKPKPQRADNWQVEELVRKLGEAKMDASPTAEDASKTASAFASASRVATAAVTDNSGTQTLEVRKKGEDYYAKSSVAQGVFKVAKDLGDALSKPLDELRNRKLFDFGFNEPSNVIIRDGGKSYSFSKNGEKWFSNGKQMDATSVQSLIDKLREFKTIKFVDTGFTTPVSEITVTSDSGKRVEKAEISQSGNSYFARRQGEPAIYELDSKDIDELRRAAGDVKEPPPPSKPAAK